MTMLRHLTIAAATFSILIAGAAPLSAAPCRDSKGKFIKCAERAAPVRCKDAKGKFAKCGTPGAKPA